MSYHRSGLIHIAVAAARDLSKKKNGFCGIFSAARAACRRASDHTAVMATIRDIDSACAFGEVATVEEWLDSGHHPDEAVTTLGGRSFTPRQEGEDAT